MLINLPSTDELYIMEAGLWSGRKWEIASVPRKSWVINIGELFHEHPGLMRTFGKTQCRIFCTFVFNREPVLILNSWIRMFLKPKKAWDVTYPMCWIGLGVFGSGFAERIHFPFIKDAWKCPAFGEGKYSKSNIFHAGMPVGFDSPLTHAGSAWHSPALLRMTTLVKDWAAAAMIRIDLKYSTNLNKVWKHAVLLQCLLFSQCKHWDV